MTGLIPSLLKNHFVWVACVLLTTCGLPAGNTAADEMAVQGVRQLVSEVYRNGSVRVIVTLDVEGDAQPDVGAIERVQRILLEELSLFRVSKIEQFRSLPILVLEVDPVALGYLLASPAVSAVNPDAVARPMAPLPGGSLQGRPDIQGSQ